MATTPQQQQANQTGAGLGGLLGILNGVGNILSPVQTNASGIAGLNSSNASGVLNPTLGVAQGAAQNVQTNTNPTLQPNTNTAAWNPILSALGGIGSALNPITNVGNVVKQATTPTVATGPGYTGPNDPDPAHKTVGPSPVQSVGNSIATANNTIYTGLQGVAQGAVKSINGPPTAAANGGQQTPVNVTVQLPQGTTAQQAQANPNATAQQAISQMPDAQVAQIARQYLNSNGQGALANGLSDAQLAGYARQYIAQGGNINATTTGGTAAATTATGASGVPANQNGVYVSPYANQASANQTGQPSWATGTTTATNSPTGTVPSTQVGYPTGATAAVPAPTNSPAIANVQANPAMATTPQATPTTQSQTSYEAEMIAAMIQGSKVVDSNGTTIADFSSLPVPVRQTLYQSIVGQSATATPQAPPQQLPTATATSVIPGAATPPVAQPMSPLQGLQAMQPTPTVPNPNALMPTSNSATASTLNPNYLAGRYPSVAANPQALAGYAAIPAANGAVYVPGWGVIPAQDIKSSTGSTLQGQYLLAHLDKLARTGVLPPANFATTATPTGGSIAPIPNATPMAQPNVMPPIPNSTQPPTLQQLLGIG